MTGVRPFLVALVSYVVLDGIWLGVLMAGFYRNALGPLAWGMFASAAMAAAVSILR